MANLIWDNWYRSDAARKYMDETLVANTGRTFTEVFYEAMRLVFYDENNNPGLLYQEKLIGPANIIVEANGRLVSCDKSKNKPINVAYGDMVKMLQVGDFDFNSSIFHPRLRFEGPTQGQIAAGTWAHTDELHTIEIDFYKLADSSSYFNPVTQNEVFTAGDDLFTLIAYYTGGVILHEIMHDHGFFHCGEVENWVVGSAYASSLPHVAKLSVLAASGYWDKFSQLYPDPKLNGLNAFNQATPPRWHNFTSVGGKTVGTTGAVALADKTTIDLYAVGMDLCVWQRWWDGSHWQPLAGWHKVDGVEVRGKPIAVSLNMGHRSIFNLAPNGNVLHKLWQNNAWTQENLGGSFKWHLTGVAVPGENVIDVFAMDSNGRIFQRSRVGGTWTPSWALFDDNRNLNNNTNFFILSFDAVSAKAGHRLLLGRGTDGKIYGNYWYSSASAWGGWSEILGEFDGQLYPTSVPGGPATDVYGVGKDGQIYQKWTTDDAGMTWTDQWSLLGKGGLDHVGSLTVVALHAAHRDIFAQGPVGDVVHMYWGPDGTET